MCNRYGHRIRAFAGKRFARRGRSRWIEAGVINRFGRFRHGCFLSSVLQMRFPGGDPWAFWVQAEERRWNSSSVHPLPSGAFHCDKAGRNDPDNA